MKQDGHKKQRLGELIKRETGRLLRSSFADRRLRDLSITRVELTDDFSEATLYWDSLGNMGERKDIQKALTSGAGRMRSALAALLTTRRTPRVRFSYDSSFEDERTIERLLGL